MRCFLWGIHWENTAAWLSAWLSWPCFHTPLHNYPTDVSSAGSHQALLDSAAASTAFLCNFANTGPRNLIQLPNRCAMCWKKKKIYKINLHIWWNLEQIWHSWHTWATSKGSRTMGLQWPDKHNKTRFATWPGMCFVLFCFFHVLNLPSLTMFALGWIE